MRAKHDSKYSPASSGPDRTATGRDPDGIHSAIHADREHISAEDAASCECVGDGAQFFECDSRRASRAGARRRGLSECGYGGVSGSALQRSGVCGDITRAGNDQGLGDIGE